MAARDDNLADDLQPTRRELLRSTAGALALGVLALPADAVDVAGGTGTPDWPCRTGRRLKRCGNGSGICPPPMRREEGDD